VSTVRFVAGIDVGHLFHDTVTIALLSKILEVLTCALHHEGISAFSVWTQCGLISAKSSQLCGDQVSLSVRPWMSSYIMQCVS
jgi:hypothetical protein